jgi:hypothetical protein
MKCVKILKTEEILCDACKNILEEIDFDNDPRTFDPIIHNYN